MTAVLQQSVSQVFKEWAHSKGANHFKSKGLKDHIRDFEAETGFTITLRMAHGIIARLVQRRNRHNTGAKNGYLAVNSSSLPGRRFES